MYSLLFIFCSLWMIPAASWPWSKNPPPPPPPPPVLKDGSNDPTSCQSETFIMALKRQTLIGKYRAGDNPCSNTLCKGNNYCQCKWAVSSCYGNRPDCPVNTQCRPCPRGYQCNGNGFAFPPMNGLLSSMKNRVYGFITSLRGHAHEV